MNKPEITIDKVKTLLDTKYIKVFDLQYEEGKHYYDASRRNKEDLAAIMTDEQHRNMIPDAVILCVILRMIDEDRLLLFYEYRYPAGRFVLGPPSGLIDPEDCLSGRENAIRQASVRELYEETGITFTENDEYRLLSSGIFCSPGLGDETCAVSVIVINDPDPSALTDSHTVGTELFDGFCLLTHEEAMQCVRDGKDQYGNSLSMSTWQTLLIFVSDLWK